MENKEKPISRGHGKMNMFMMEMALHTVDQQYSERKINSGFHKIQKLTLSSEKQTVQL